MGGLDVVLTQNVAIFLNTISIYIYLSFVSYILFVLFSVFLFFCWLYKYFLPFFFSFMLGHISESNYSNTASFIWISIVQTHKILISNQLISPHACLFDFLKTKENDHEFKLEMIYTNTDHFVMNKAVCVQCTVTYTSYIYTYFLFFVFFIILGKNLIFF